MRPPTDMSIRSGESTDSQGQLSFSERRGLKMSLGSTSSNSTDYVSTVPRVISPPPSCRSPPPRTDRLSLRLRSNSGLTLHTNEAALSRYINYKEDRLMRQPSFTKPLRDSPLDEDDSNPSSTKKTPWAMRPYCCPSFPTDLSDEVFQLGLNHPIIAQKFRAYCREQGCEGYLEFLIKIQEYTESTNEMASILTAISTSFIASGATHPLNLPTMMSRTLNADVKRIAHTTLPGLEAVFLEPKSHIERWMTTTIFPGFVKSQLMQYTTVALSLRASGILPPKMEFPGLGESFCIINNSNSLVTAVTDAFLRITGSPLRDTVHRSCYFLQGSYIDNLGEGRETAELLLISPKDREPSWNLCFLYPLRNKRGQLQCWLGAQVDVSHSLSSREALLQVIDCTNQSNPGSTDSISEKSSRKGIITDTKPDGDRSIHSRESSQSSSFSRSRLLQQLRRPLRSPYSSLISESVEYILSTTEQKSTQNDYFSSQRFQTKAQFQISPTTYSSHILLRCNPPQDPSSRQRVQTPSGTKARRSLKMDVMFYSEEAADMLSVYDDITHMDIFRVLSGKARSPSITKYFKSGIRDRVACGKSTVAEVIVDTSHRSHGRQKPGIGARRPSTAEVEGHHKSEKKLAKGPRQERLITHWTPMRNAEGAVEMVILILSPSI
ncbi:hypothetical protein F5Y04DRAFT_131433 [Hypomontagnella monticulosa]|nr:hypothetical protein F5Y04DRAFT_131433 [Hypomontagnella monticulosa]